MSRTQDTLTRTDPKPDEPTPPAPPHPDPPAPTAVCLRLPAVGYRGSDARRGDRRGDHVVAV